MFTLTIGEIEKSVSAGLNPELPGLLAVNSAVNIPPLDGAEVNSSLINKIKIK